MTTLEKLFLQIFDQKDSIIQQLQQQADSYTQQLASRLVIDGLTPPPWLLTPNSSNPNGLEKEDIISKLLLGPPQNSTRYSTGAHSLYYLPVVAGGNINKQVSTEMCTETRALNKSINLSDEHNVTLECHNNGIVGGLDHVPELDDSAKSPQNETDTRKTSIYAAPDTSVARIQRSKSRQKAWEVRSKGKSTAKSCSSNENRTCLSFSGEPESKKDFSQVIQDKCLFENEHSKVGSSSDKEEFLYYPPVVAGGNINKQLSTETCTETHALNKSINLGNEHMVTLECHNNDIAGGLDHVPELDDSAKSPQNETDARITNIYAAPDTSVARIQRSKSRQKARELRSKGKTTAKSCPSNENRTCLYFSGEPKSKKYFSQVVQDKCPLENEYSKVGSSSDKEELDGGIMVGPTGDSLQQSCHVNGVIEGVNLPDACLGSYASKKSTGMTQDTQSQNNLCGIITRSRTSSQQTSGINKSSKPGTSVSCHPKDGGALSHSVGDLMHEVGISNKLSDAAETSQVVGDINVETQTTCSNEGVLKPVVTSCIDMKESTLGVDHQENSEIVVRNEPINEPVAMQPVNSGIKLDPVTLMQSSDCCKNVKPKQLNFDEIDECDLNEISGSLSKRRKLDGLLGKECNPSKGSASSKDHKSSCNFFEQQSPKANVMSRSLETARAHSYNNIDEMKNIDYMNENTVVEDVEHNSKFSLHDDIGVTREVILSPREVNSKFDKEMHSEKSRLNEDQASSLDIQTKEDDLDHKSRESAAGVYIPISNTKSSFTSSLTKQGNKGLEDCLDKEVNKPEVDLDSSKSKEFEVGTNAKVSNMTLNSAKVNNTWPLNQQKNVEDQPNCFLDSRNFRVHIQRDAIHCDLETPENGLNLLKESASVLSSEKIHLAQSDGMQSCDKRVHDEMNCDLSEGTESLLVTQAAKEIVTEVDDDPTEITATLKQAEPPCVLNLIKDADVGPANSIINSDVAVNDNNNIEINLPQSSQNDDNTMVVSDDIPPVYEGFIIDEEIENVNMGNYDGGIDFDLLEIPSTAIERASIIEQICKSASMQTPLPQFPSSFNQHQVHDLYGFMADGILDEDSRKNLQTSDNGITKLDSGLPHQQKFDYSTPFYFQSKNHYSSPVGKLWERSASSSGSSEIQLSSNPDLTCFPIEEDPNSNEENDDEVAVEVQEAPIESTEVCTQHENHVSMSSMKYPERYSSNSVGIEVSVPRTREKVKHKPRIPHGIKVSRYNEDNRNSSIATRASSKGNISLNSKNKSSMRSRIPSLSQKEAKRNNNIVSNVTSFIPIVQQKQAAAVCTGKRDIKVKALEAAEAAKHREQEKENERKLKKEALKLERERIVKENKLNLKKQEELKKKEADIRKRQREEEERNQLAKKRKLVAQKNQKFKYEKSCVKSAAMAGNKKNSENLRQNKNADESSFQKQDTILERIVQQVTSVPGNRDVSNDCGEKDMATSVHETSPVNVVPVKLTSQENSYDISPYQCSDDEDDDEDDVPNKKFVPSWASKNRVAMVLPLQQKLDPDSIFSMDSFCNMDEVLLPRRLQAQ